MGLMFSERRAVLRTAIHLDCISRTSRNRRAFRGKHATQGETRPSQVNSVFAPRALAGLLPGRSPRPHRARGVGAENGHVWKKVLSRADLTNSFLVNMGRVSCEHGGEMS